jgi:hypothetical protein
MDAPDIRPDIRWDYPAFFDIRSDTKLTSRVSVWISGKAG